MFLDLVSDLDFSHDKARMTKKTGTHLLKQFHQKRGGLIYRSCGFVRGPQLVIQLLSCQDNSRTTSSHRSSKNRTLLHQASLDMVEPEESPPSPCETLDPVVKNDMPKASPAISPGKTKHTHYYYYYHHHHLPAINPALPQRTIRPRLHRPPYRKHRRHHGMDPVLSNTPIHHGTNASFA